MRRDQAMNVIGESGRGASIARRWLSRHVSTVITATSLVVIAALIATVAIVSDGYTAQRMDLDDAAVWVANGENQVIGRANTEILEFNTVVASDGSDLDVVQQGRSVLLLDRANTRLDVVDAATSSVIDSVALPTDTPRVYLSAGTAIIHAEGTGEVWILSESDLGGFDASAEATLSLGPGSVVAVSETGILFAYSPETSQLHRIEPNLGAAATGAGAESTTIDVGSTDDAFHITAVGNRPVIFNSDSRELWLDGARADLSAVIGSGSTATLQQPGPSSGRVFVSWDGGVADVTFDGTVTGRVDGRTGSPAAPVVVDGCAFAAWTDGTAWRSCRSQEPTEFALASAGSAVSRLVFAVNGARVLLNDPVAGATWAVQNSGELIDNWDDLILVEQDDEQVEQSDADAPPEYEKAQLPPVAVDDVFGARPGRATILPLLLNDFDPNGDVLMVTEIGAIDETFGHLDVVRDGQQVQITLTPTAQGSASFPYTITDGRGGSASAVVRVDVRSPEENSPPEQVRQSRTLVAQGGRVTTNVLADFVDPDGDAFYLTAASVAKPDLVSYKPGGEVVFQEGGSPAALRSVGLTVSDGTSSGSGALSITVSPAGEVPIIAEPFAVTSYAGSEVRISPLSHVRGGTGQIRLSAVPSRTGATITPNFEAGTFRFVSDQVRSFSVEYVVTDGSQTATGIVRVEVKAPPDANSIPITTPKTVFIKTLSSETVNVAALDTDPAGGVLMVLGVSNDTAPAVTAEVLEQKSIRLSLIAPLESGSATLTYRITNGLATAIGTITVIEIPHPLTLQAPVATDDTVTVRVGDTIDIPVLANDLHPDGEIITLNPTLVKNVENAGLLFASGERLRYLAPSITGNFTAIYEIVGPDGQTAQAQVRIAVREVVEATNKPPTPGTVTARVVAGGTVMIRVPLTGIDPDGDSVQLLGQESNPGKGAVTEVGTDFIEYEAGGYSAGTDTFTYTVMDSLGARATGRVRVGIAPPLDEVRNPVATADAVTTRPGGSISIQVLANDIDPDGGSLTVVEVDPNPGVTAEIVGDVVVVTPPVDAGSYGLVYTIENEVGGRSSNFITVTVDPDAPLAHPLAADTVLTLSDILDRETVTVDVLQNVFFADGPVDTLRLRLVDGYKENASITARNSITVTVGERSQIIPFAVEHPDDSSVVSYAFIRVPGLADALPQLDRRAKPLTVTSESRLVIDLNDYVIAVGGKQVQLTDTSTVRATNANGDSLVVDSDTLAFTSADKYFGPASISFEVTDGASATATGARTATLVLPIKVTPRENQPPVFAGGTIEFEPAEEKVLDLLKLTNYPHPDDFDELVYRVLEPLPTGFSYTLSGSTLTLRANADSAKGTQTAIALGVRDDLSDGQAGKISLRVVSSSRPLARPAADTATTPRGKSTIIDVLANDQATNPFPGQPLEVVDIRGLDGGSLPAGVSVVPSADRSRLTVTVAPNAEPVDAQLQYQVADATGDPDRFVWGSITVSVQDVPDAPVAPTRVGGHVNGELTLRITPPAFNNSAITGYEVVSSSNGGYRKNCGLDQLCVLTDLQVGRSYEFQVIATNAIGPSAAGSSSVALRVDYLPAAPTGVTARASTTTEAELVIGWDRTPNPSPGTPVVGYTVRISGPGFGQTDITTASTSLTTSVGGLIQAGQNYSVTVFSRNSAQASADEWNSSSAVAVTAVGSPLPVAVSASVTGSDGSIRVSWQGGGWNGAPSGNYSVARFIGDSPPSTCATGVHPGAIPGSGTSGWVDTSTTDGIAYVYAVYSDNGLFCSVSVSAPVESKRPPGRASATLDVVHQADGYFDLRVSGLRATGHPVRYEYAIGADALWRPVVDNQFVTSPASSGVYGQSVTVQVRACRDAGQDLCGAPSAAISAMPVATRASVIACTAGEPFVPIAPPNNGAGLTVTYAVDYAIGGVFGGMFVGHTAGQSAPPLATGLRIKATVSDGTNTYQDPLYAEIPCS
ncbi:Ig-like domain-containing protein [Salinibacterium hongtaonis]|uniref:Fibronectin type III domain-containing protein n=1 Tax=Homoserinimonas hongtaonis TaxID=2079791 RepID=A0A2U1SXB9_9MICO|nr:Ig-like domain-containing protein [Salinibacterium hongtaonis]PWB96246.1 fibronectin type III domain-containing protein [Salinibacterium hongtaonis]